MVKWNIAKIDKSLVLKLSKLYDIPGFTSMLLVVRGITEVEEIEEFFSDTDDLDDPMLIKDMDKAVKRIRDAIENNEKICVYGDYDCDGVTSTAILYSYLESVFADVMYYIPDRNAEGYGMNISAVDKLKEAGVNLIITVDNGISAIDEISYAGKLGIDVVVTDHHKPLDILPSAVAVVNPHRNDEIYDFRDYSGAGLALKLVYSLDENNFLIIENYADLAALGTVADIVPLKGENRKIVKYGMFALKNTERPGLTYLMEKAAVTDISSNAIGFRIGPRINAAGRLGSPYDALELFLTEDEETAEEKANLLCELNSSRQSIEGEIIKDINALIEKDTSLTENRIIVLSSENWNAGIVGIVSARITEKYGKPSIIISEDGTVCKASGRSVEGFSLVDAIFACSDLLEKYGGHNMAVGFSIKKENIGAFTKKINDYANKLMYMPLYSLKVDYILKPEAIAIDMVNQLERFEPFGNANAQPVFGLTEMHLDKIISVGGGKHIKLSVSKGNTRLAMMKFHVTAEDFPYSEGDTLDIAFNMEKNEYQGRQSISFIIQNIKLSGFDIETAMKELQDYELYKKGIFIKEKHNHFPDRNEFAAVYRYLKKKQIYRYSLDCLSYKVNEDIGVFKLLIILDIMNELHFIKYTRKADILYIELCEVTGKTDLRSSSVYRKLEEEISNAG